MKSDAEKLTLTTTITLEQAGTWRNALEALNILQDVEEIITEDGSITLEKYNEYLENVGAYSRWKLEKRV